MRITQRRRTYPGRGATLAMAAALTLLAAVCTPAVAQLPGSDGSLPPAEEQSNYSKGEERQADYKSDEFQALLQQRVADDPQERAFIAGNDPERRFEGNLCSSHIDGCAGEVRLYDWEENGFGIQTPISYVSRSGAVIVGRIWATEAGLEGRRPGIVITNGSVQAPEQLYWAFAASLAKAGYVVMTWDPQGQGRSDTPGGSRTPQEGVPSQSGGPFFWGPEDALDFFLSTPDSPYRPRPPQSGGQPYTDKQDRRVQEKGNLDDKPLANAFNPWHEMIDRSKIGIAGHSFGAAGVSYVGQADPRVDAIVAWDNLEANDDGTVSDLGSEGRNGPDVPITTPALGMSNDYGIPPLPGDYASPGPRGSGPKLETHDKAFEAYKGKGVDAMQVNKRGGTHYEYSYIPNDGFRATLRGIDSAVWYSVAWFDKYVKGSPGASGASASAFEASPDRRLLTDRWCNDAIEAGVDPKGDGNSHSFLLPGRVSIGLEDGGRSTIDNLREACASPALAPDGDATPFSFLEVARTADSAQSGGDGGEGDADDDDADPAEGDADSTDGDSDDSDGEGNGDSAGSGGGSAGADVVAAGAAAGDAGGGELAFTGFELAPVARTGVGLMALGLALAAAARLRPRRSR
ncbi:MAG: hypothetical protein ACR2NA_08435 [Solirubrobacterales bacterium]